VGAEMNLDTTLLHEADRVKTGAYAHELNRLTNLYKSACERGDLTSFAIHEDSLRRLVTVIKRRAQAAPTCQHTDMRKHTITVAGNPFAFLFCDECGRSVAA
jgi:hypothetical protein